MVKLSAMPPTASAMFHPATADQAALLMIIAEIGVNHDGDPDKAVDLVATAAASGADAVKFQLFDPRRLLSNQARFAQYQEQAHAQSEQPPESPFEMLDKLKLTPRDLEEPREEAADAGVKFIVTPFSLEDVPPLRDLDVDAVKIASPDAVNYPLLEAAAKLGRPLLISTGTCELDELEFAANLLKGHAAGGCLMHCVSSYPTPMEAATLGAIRAIMERYGLPVGYSDHTTEMHSGALAVAAGACVLEKHITLTRDAEGPDHASSLEPIPFTHYADLAREAAGAVGSLRKAVHPIEADVRSVSRQSLCLTRDLPAGHVLQAQDLTVKRPGTGIPAAQLTSTLGKSIRRAVRGNDLLQASDLQG